MPAATLEGPGPLPQPQSGPLDLNRLTAPELMAHSTRFMMQQVVSTPMKEVHREFAYLVRELTMLKNGIAEMNASQLADKQAQQNRNGEELKEMQKRLLSAVRESEEKVMQEMRELRKAMAEREDRLRSIISDLLQEKEAQVAAGLMGGEWSVGNEPGDVNSPISQLEPVTRPQGKLKDKEELADEDTEKIGKCLANALVICLGVLLMRTRRRKSD